VLGLLGLTLVLGLLFVAEGVSDLFTYVATHKGERSGWMLLDGLVTTALGVVIWTRWPFGSLWIAGTLAGISMLMSGVTRLMMVLSAHKISKHASDHFIEQK